MKQVIIVPTIELLALLTASSEIAMSYTGATILTMTGGHRPTQRADIATNFRKCENAVLIGTLDAVSVTPCEYGPIDALVFLFCGFEGAEAKVAQVKNRFVSSAGSPVTTAHNAVSPIVETVHYFQDVFA